MTKRIKLLSKNAPEYSTKDNRSFRSFFCEWSFHYRFYLNLSNHIELFSSLIYIIDMISVIRDASIASTIDVIIVWNISEHLAHGTNS